MMKNKINIVYFIVISIIIGAFNVYSNNSLINNIYHFNQSNQSYFHNNHLDKALFLADGTNFDENKNVNKNNVKQTYVDVDTSDYTLKLWENTNGDVLINLKLKNKEQKIKISVWNMLGKSVIEDFDGKYTDLEDNHIINQSNLLSRGAYILRIQGDKLKLDLKFIKSK